MASRASRVALKRLLAAGGLVLTATGAAALIGRHNFNNYSKQTRSEQHRQFVVPKTKNIRLVERNGKTVLKKKNLLIFGVFCP